MASIEGHRVFVLTVSYPGGRIRQLSLRRERVAHVRRWLCNYQELKEAHFGQVPSYLANRIIHCAVIVATAA
jgi:hypothetical protein